MSDFIISAYEQGAQDAEAGFDSQAGQFSQDPSDGEYSSLRQEYLFGYHNAAFIQGKEDRKRGVHRYPTQYSKASFGQHVVEPFKAYETLWSAYYAGFNQSVAEE